MRFIRLDKKSKSAAFLISAVALSSSAVAGGFQLWEQDASGIGNYHAGAAARANSAGTEFYNPAGMTRLKHAQVSLGSAFIAVATKYTGDVLLNGIKVASIKNFPGDSFNAVPNFHLVIPFKSHWAFGLGLTTPFGLETDYPNIPSTGLFPNASALATKTELQTFNINPNLAYQVNQYLSLAAGFDVLYGKANYDSDFIHPLNTRLTGWDYGYNVGVLIQLPSNTRVGVSYRSEIKVHATGTSSAGALTDNNASAVFPLPATTMISIYQKINQKWRVMASAFYTQWSVFRSLFIKSLETPLGPGNVNLLENYRNTWNFSVGAIFQMSKKLGFTAGFGHDQTPTRVGYRDIRLPGNDRYALAFGIIIKPSKRFTWSMGYTHFFINRTTIDSRRSVGPGTTTPVPPPAALGFSDGNVNVFGMQFAIDLGE